MGDEYGPGEHPNSRAALEPFRPGFDPRRRIGAPSLGREVTAYMNMLGAEDQDGQALYPEAELRAIIQDPRSAHAKVIAAQEILRARLEGFDKIGRVPQAANSIDRIIDRTDGKPTQRIEVTRPKDRTLEELGDDLVRLLTENPALLDSVRVQVELVSVARQLPALKQRLRPLLEVHAPEMLPALETTATVIADDRKVANAAASDLPIRDIRAEGTHGNDGDAEEGAP